MAAFVSDYNSLINAADDSETKQISRNLESMKSLTDINSKSLAKVGITVDSKSGKLSVDEDTFKRLIRPGLMHFLRGMALMLMQLQARLQCLSMLQRMRQKRLTHMAPMEGIHRPITVDIIIICFIVKDRQGITHLTLRLNKRSIPVLGCFFLIN